MMQPAGAGPAVRAAVDRFIAERGRDSVELLLDEAQRFIPTHRNELVTSAQVSRFLSMSQESGPDIRAIDPEVTANDLRQAVIEGGRMRILRKRGCPNDLPVAIGRDVVDAPMRCRLDRSCLHRARSRYVTLQSEGARSAPFDPTISTRALSSPS